MTMHGKRTQQKKTVDFIQNVEEFGFVDERKHEVAKHDLDKLDLNKYEPSKRETSKKRGSIYDLNKLDLFKHESSMRDIMKSKKRDVVKRVESKRDISNFDLKKYDVLLNNDNKKLNEIPEVKKEELDQPVKVSLEAPFTGKSKFTCNNYRSLLLS